VGNSYWISEINYTIAHTGYGDGTDPGADRVEVVETWGNEMGYYLADRYYGLNHSIAGSSTAIADLERSRHYYLLENRKFRYHPPDDIVDYIPWALFHDLVDENSLNPSGVSEYSGITDNVKHFTHLQIYEVLTSSVTSIEAFKEKLRENNPTYAGNTQADYDALFSSYNY